MAVADTNQEAVEAAVRVNEEAWGEDVPESRRAIMQRTLAAALAIERPIIEAEVREGLREVLQPMLDRLSINEKSDRGVTPDYFKGVHQAFAQVRTALDQEADRG